MGDAWGAVPWRELWGLILPGGAAVVAMMAVLWALHLRWRNAGVVDVGWTVSIGVLAIFAATSGAGDPTRRLLVGLVGGGWSLRLASHLVHRVSREPEDSRYGELRARWKTNLFLKFLAFFLFQGVLATVLALPFFAAAVDGSGEIALVTWMGVALAAVSVVGEGIADAQLRGFKANPANRGEVCRVGLWGWSRHPNYFFDWLIWCAFSLLALPSPGGWLSLGGPAMMLYFLLRVTGIPATEAHAVRSRGERYRQYQREVSAFVPLPPRRGS